MAAIEEFKIGMMTAFEMSNLWSLHHLLGLEIKRSKRYVFVSQSRYAEDLMSKFNMPILKTCKDAKARQYPIPMNTCEKLFKEVSRGDTYATRYKNMVGGLLYLSNTSSDIVFGKNKKTSSVRLNYHTRKQSYKKNGFSSSF